VSEQELSTYRPFVFTVVEDDGVNVTIEVSEEDLMPKQMMNEQPYVVDRAHIDWRLVELQQNRWYKLPK
jgi:hypothetical protein